MKIKSFITLLLIALLSLVAFVSCSDNAGESSSGENSILVNSASHAFRDISGLKDFRANISSSTVAVGKQEGSVSRDVSISLDTYPKYLLVKVDEWQTQAEPVTFTAKTNTKINGRTINAGDMVTQENLTGSVDKVYVIGDYTLVSFLTVDVLTLINRKETEVQSDSYSTRYNGSLNLSSNESNNGGTNEYIWYQYNVPNNKSNEEAFNIEYTYSKWWRDSNGRHNSEDIRLRDNLTLRCAYNNVQALNEYNGVAVYDTFDYYTSDFRSSFIIDNNTGLIYAIPYGKDDDRMNLSVHQGVVIDKNLGPVKLSINGSGELELEQILANKSVYIYDVFKDSNDQYYIRTDSLSETDDDVKFYIICGEYIPTEDGRVIHVTYNNSVVGNSNWLYQITDLSYVGKNFIETPIPLSNEVTFNYLSYLPDNNGDWRMNSARGLYDYNQKNGFDYWRMNNNLSSGAKAKFQCIKDGVLYLQGVTESELFATEYNLQTKDILCTNMRSYNGNLKFALLDGRKCIIARKQANSLYTLFISNSSTPASDSSYSQSIYHVNGTQEWINDEERIWRYAYDNDLAVECIDASNNRSYPREYYNLTINGESKGIIFAEGYDYDSVRDEYYGKDLPILTDVTVSDWKGYGDAFTMTFNVATKRGTNSYKVIKYGIEGYRVVLDDSSFVKTTTLILQPINR